MNPYGSLTSSFSTTHNPKESIKPVDESEHQGNGQKS
jgi:hypothetical protein